MHLFFVMLLLDTRNISFVMQVSELKEGEVIHDPLIYEKMRMKRPDLKKPQPNWPEYYGNAQEGIQDYCDMVKARHPVVDDPLDVEADEESLILSGRGLKHGRLNFMNAVAKHTLSMNYTRLKAVNTSDNPIPPHRQPRRPTYDVSFHHLSYFRSCMAKC